MLKWFGRFLVSLFLTCGFAAQAQNQTEKSLIKEADEDFQYGDFKDAIDLYSKALEINPNNPHTHLMVGRAMLASHTHKEDAVFHLKKALELNMTVSNKLLFYIGEGFRFRYEFDSAIARYEMYEVELQTNRRMFEGMNVEYELEKVRRRIYECGNAFEYVTDPGFVEIVNMGDPINSPYQEYAPTFSRDEETMYFTSRRPGGVSGNEKDKDNNYFEDIYVSYKVDGKWTEPKNMGLPVNSTSHESNVGLSPDGQTLYIYRPENGGDIYYSEHKKNKWTKPKPLKELNTEYRETSICFSADGQMLFYSSDHPEGIGRSDIYMCRKKKNGKWGKAENLGTVINTNFDEEGPYYDDSTSTLYFSSKGHKGMGGYDLYKSVYDSTKGEWGTPENLRYPINSADDDLFFTKGAVSGKFYYASYKQGSKGGQDLYFIVPSTKKQLTALTRRLRREKFEKEKIEVVSSQKEGVTVILEIADRDSREPIPAKVRIFYEGEEEPIDSVDVLNGRMVKTFNLDKDQNYVFTVDAEGYMYGIVDLSVPGNLDKPQKIEEHLFLRKPEVGETYLLKHVYFEHDKYHLSDRSIPELQEVLNLVNSNPGMRIEIGGHTDHIGKDHYNMVLSEKRAESVRNYLIEQGVDPSRVESKGYGETRPLASNDDETEGRALNRRTELRLLELGSGEQ